MLTSNFYKLINAELYQILDKNPNDENLHKHKDVANNKGYAFLVWFLAFYGQKSSYRNYITDGKDDSSCDIIFSNMDTQGQEIFYVVQSKWLNIASDEEGQLLRKGKVVKEYPKIEKEEFNAVISEFTTVINGTRTAGTNEKFNNKSQELVKHLEKNGKAKFLFFTVAAINEEIHDSIKSFNKENAPNTSLEVIDIDRIKRDYIEFKFKEVVANNPLEYKYNPEDSDIELAIERYKNGDNSDKSDNKSYVASRDMLQFEGTKQAYIFLLKPKTIHQLFQKYKFNLFFKNVRNPLHRSNYNEKIVETLQRKPDSFWYFNNGVTAITKRIPDIGKTANTLTVKGLQIINGAQTIYSIYKAYENASYDQREIMDTDARISFRLIRSSDEDFNLEITRYTNRQNEMQPRDFVANLDEQQRLQLESFKTNYWYEKRRDEFRLDENTKVQNNITVVENNLFALAYVAFHLQKPMAAILHQDKFFLKRTEDAEGLYEEIFNANTKFVDMCNSFLIWEMVLQQFSTEDNKGNLLFQLPDYLMPFVITYLALSKIVLQKYLNVKYSNETKSVNLQNFVKEAFESHNQLQKRIIEMVINYTSRLLASRISSDNNEITQENYKRLAISPTFYDFICQEVENKEITVEDIESIDLK